VRDVKEAVAENRLQIASVCRLLPTPGDESAGTFIANRLTAMSMLADVRVVQPVPYFPGLRPSPPWSRNDTRQIGSLQVQHAPMFYIPGALKSMDGRWLARSIRDVLREMRRSARLDLIDAHFGYPDGVGCARVAAELGVPHFITIRGLETDILERPEVRDQLLSALHSAAGVISVSHSLRELVASRGIDADKVLVAPNAVDRTLFRPGQCSAARAKLKVSDDEALIVCVGHLLSVKRHSVLIDAVAILRSWIPARLVIIGGPSYEPDYPGALREQVARLGLADYVQFVGKLPPREVVEWLRAANVFALASAREGCCNAVLEALATGAPVVATRVGDNPHFVKEELNGYLVAPDDAAALAAALRRALSRDWNGAAISSSLAVGTWADTASRVIEFMRGRLGTSAARTAA
jgi:glycosyltransferase involved in cell wall biosynthesis